MTIWQILWPMKSRLLLAGLGLVIIASLFALRGHDETIRGEWRKLRREAGLVLRDIRISGLVHADDSMVLEAIGSTEGLPIDTVDLNAMAARLRDLPWVADVDIRRYLPDRLDIAIIEREPFALWQRDGHLVLVDRTGTLLTGHDLARWRDLPLLVGDNAPEAAMAILAELAAWPDLAADVEALIRVGGRRWDIKLASGVLLRLPAEPLPGEPAAYGPHEAIVRFAGLERRYSLLGRDIAILDFRLPDRLVIRMTKDGRALLLEDGKSV